MESEITLEEYLEIVRQEIEEIVKQEIEEIVRQKIEEFKERYVEGHEQDPKNFPLKMTESDWNEQELAIRNFEVL